jgi:diguanylate cyclase (GGDEF)-like protein
MVVVDRMRVHPRNRARNLAFLRTPWVCRVWVVLAVLAALVAPPLLSPLGREQTAAPELLTGLLLVGLSVLNIEIGRMLEGGVSRGQRPHKGLTAWALACALLLPTWWLLPVVTVAYLHGWWRGVRVTPWKWIGSAAYVVLAGLAAAITARAVLGAEPNLMTADGRSGLLAVLGAAAAFLLVATVLFHASAYLNHAEDEAWLRRTLASPSFYLTESGVLLVGGLSAAIWTGGGWFVVLLAPIYLMAQRAALHEPLREQAEHDDKTGALRFESWRRLANARAERCTRQGRPWCVLFADLDNFRDYNETWGHMVGDEALVAVADAIAGELRDGDLFARFGGEEFCVFLPDLAVADAGPVAERIRTRVSVAQVPSALPVTISIGVAAVSASGPAPEFISVLTAADRALFRAKHEGRDRSTVTSVDAA